MDQQKSAGFPGNVRRTVASRIRLLWFTPWMFLTSFGGDGPTDACGFTWQVGSKLPRHRHLHRCVLHNAHNNDCRCKCRVKDRGGRSAYDFFMNLRAAEFMKPVASVRRNPLAEMLAEIEREANR